MSTHENVSMRLEVDEAENWDGEAELRSKPWWSIQYNKLECEQQALSELITAAKLHGWTPRDMVPFPPLDGTEPRPIPQEFAEWAHLRLCLQYNRLLEGWYYRADALFRDDN